MVESLFKDGEYRFREAELMPSVIAEIIKALYAGKRFKRNEALKEIIQFHREHGGLLGHANYTAAMKKALGKTLKAENPSYGVWYINTDDLEESVIENVLADPPVIDAELDFRSQPDQIIGIGDQAVYLYYYDTYRDMAHLQDKDVWMCKIGRTDTDPIQRIMSQAGTCVPEFPHIALVINCKNSSMLESTLHNILKIRGRWLEDAPGKEWYTTSPTEIVEIYQMVMGTQA